jgi:hypothetical protein
VITGYQYCRSSCTTASNWRSTGTKAGVPNATVLLTGISLGSTVTVKIRAINAFGTGPVATLSMIQPV